MPTMSEKLPPSLEGKLPTPTEHADIIAKWVPTIALAAAGAWFPSTAFAGAAAFAGALYPLVYEKFVEGPMRILLEQLRKGNVPNLSDKQLVPFVPMGFKFFEAAKEGEYEHNLRILAAFLRGELEQDIPDASNFARMVRRVENLSLTDLKVMAMVSAHLTGTSTSFIDEGAGGKRPFVSATFLQTSPHNNKHSLTRPEIEEALVDLAARGFLVADGAVRSAKSEEYYYASSHLRELMDRAREQIVLAENIAPKQ
jgi:hypothetical protein